MERKTVSQALARPLRTGPQGGLAWAVTEGFDAFIVDMNDRQYGILVVLLTMLFSFLQASLENGLGKAFLRRLDAPRAPLTDSKHRA